jgi:protein translocase SecG subunit
MNTILNIFQIIIAILLMIGILLQQRGSGLGAAFGGGSEIHLAKRGAEKFIFTSSIILACLFLLLSLARIIWF